MIKNIVYTGIIIIIISFLILFFESSALSTQNLSVAASSLLSIKNYTVGVNSFIYYKIKFNETSNVTALMNSSSKINFYLMSNNAFLGWEKQINNASNSNTGLEDAINLENRGVYYIFRNVSNATIPVSLFKNVTITPIFSNTAPLNGTYYFVIDNTKGSASFNKEVNSTIAYVPPITNATLNSPEFKQVENMINESLWMGSIFFILLIIGIAILIYGLVRKPKEITVGTGTEKSKVDLANVDELYKGIEEKPKAKKELKTKKAKNKNKKGNK